jgi:hypothetical protein
VGLVLAALVMVSALGATTAPDLASLLEAASRAREAGDWAHAAVLLERAYALHPAPEILYNRARVAEALDALEDAPRAYPPLGLDPGDSEHIRARAGERAAELKALRTTALVRVASAEISLDGVPRAAGLVAVDAASTVAATVQDGVAYVVVLGLERGRVVRISAEALVGRATACVVVPGGLESVDDARVPTSPERVCLEPGERVLLGNGMPARPVRLVSGPNVVLDTGALDSSGGLLAPVLWAAGGGALLASGVLAAVAADQRATVTAALAQPDARGVVVALGRAEALELRHDADSAATAGAVLLGAGVAAVATATLWWWLAD